MPLVSVFRVFRVVRLLRLIPKATGLRTLFQTLAFSFPALFNVGGVLSLFFFIYAVAGVQLFGTVRRGDYLDRHANFENFGRALLTLFRISTGESWNAIMYDIIQCTNDIQRTHNRTIPDTLYPKGIPSTLSRIRDRNAAGTCCSGDVDSMSASYLGDRCQPHSWITILYFCSFILLVAFILLNVVIAVILDNFQISSRKEDLVVKVQHIEEFAKVHRNPSSCASHLSL